MKPRVSRLRHRVTFRIPGAVQDGGGGVTMGFVDGDTVAGDYRAISASRVLGAESTEVMRRAAITIRAQAMPADFDPLTWRISAAGIDHAVLSALDQDGDGRFVTLIVARAG